MPALKLHRTTAKKGPEVDVVLSPRLFAHLTRRAMKLGLPLEYLVAGLVTDTLETQPTVLSGPIQTHGYDPA